MCCDKEKEEKDIRETNNFCVFLCSDRTDKNETKMAQPQMVDIRQLNPQQLTEVSQRIDQELQVLQGTLKLYCFQITQSSLKRLPQ